jgi:4-hydroxy-L-threonine phosphate dehydrogenase PdxA
MDKPAIALTMGDPAGIGPEIVVKILASGDAYQSCGPIVVGDLGVMKDTAELLGADLQFVRIDHLAEARFSPPAVDLIMPKDLDVGDIPRGEVDPRMGRAAGVCLRTAFEMALDRKVQGVAAAPMNKEAFHLAGFDYLDELAYLADLSGSTDTFILGVMGPVWTVSVTEHIAFKEILGLIRRDRVYSYIVRMHDALLRVGLLEPRIAVAALNVHAGDGGLFGREEIDEIGPAILDAQARGIQAEGPVPADMVFVRALGGGFDGVVAMYHDQANIARKLQPKNQSATIFMGLPVVCGTTAHGTAFDIAGKGVADPGSLAAAVRYTAMLSMKSQD